MYVVDTNFASELMRPEPMPTVGAWITGCVPDKTRRTTMHITTTAAALAVFMLAGCSVGQVVLDDSGGVKGSAKATTKAKAVSEAHALMKKACKEAGAELILPPQQPRSPPPQWKQDLNKAETTLGLAKEGVEVAIKVGQLIRRYSATLNGVCQKTC